MIKPLFFTFSITYDDEFQLIIYCLAELFYPCGINCACHPTLKNYFNGHQSLVISHQSLSINHQSIITSSLESYLFTLHHFCESVHLTKTMTDPTTTIALESAINAMGKDIFDVTIICTTDDHQAEYWTKRLSEGVCKKDSTEDSIFPIVLAVSEDWGKGGAGNGLGTLYAFTKACRVAKEKHGVDLSELLTDGKVSAAIYHTAGKGTRLAPLPASENNNKPGVVSLTDSLKQFEVLFQVF